MAAFIAGLVQKEESKGLVMHAAVPAGNTICNAMDMALMSASVDLGRFVPVHMAPYAVCTAVNYSAIIPWDLALVMVLEPPVVNAGRIRWNATESATIPALMAFGSTTNAHLDQSAWLLAVGCSVHQVLLWDTIRTEEALQDRKAIILALRGHSHHRIRHCFSVCFQDPLQLL